MANKINFEDKEDLNIQGNIPEKNKITSKDMNSIKEAVNSNTLEIENINQKIGGFNPSVVVGTIIPWFNSECPDGYMVLKGQELNRERYSTLFDLIGTKYGNGNGVSTFNLPNQFKNNSQYYTLTEAEASKDFVYIMKVL